jgi:hypothetical protein
MLSIHLKKTTKCIGLTCEACLTYFVSSQVHKLGLKNEYLYNRSKKLFFLNEKQIHRGKDINDFSTVEIQMETSHQLLLFLRLLQSSYFFF